LSMLRTMLNPVRFGFFRAVLTDEGRIEPRGRTALDVGCGGGLLAEECARLGLSVTGIDPSTRSVRTAREHARESGLAINYLAGTGELLPFGDASYDAVFCCDVLEHLEKPATVIAEISRVLKPNGLFLYDTINRTLRSKIGVIGLFPTMALDKLRVPEPARLESIHQTAGASGNDGSVRLTISHCCWNEA